MAMTYLYTAVGHSGAPESLPWGVEGAGQDVGTRGGAQGSLTFKKLAKEENSQVLLGNAGSQEQSGPGDLSGS